MKDATVQLFAAWWKQKKGAEPNSTPLYYEIKISVMLFPTAMFWLVDRKPQ